MTMESPIELAELRSLVALAAHGHFGRAAEALGVSQPALTKRVQRLEDKVGGALVVRGYRELHLTEPGRLLLEHAQVLLGDSERALELSREAARGEAGRLRIGFGVASIVQMLPRTLQRFRTRHPRVQVHLRDMSTPAQLEALQTGEIDLGFVRLPVADPALECVPILHERLVVAVPTRSPWRGRKGLGSLAGQPWVACSDVISASYYAHVLALCRSAGFEPRIVAETNELFSLLQLVRAGLGVALVPSAAAAMRVPGVRFEAIRAAGPVTPAWDIGLAWSRAPSRGALVTAFSRVALQVYTGRTQA
jgi:DNA-binding transcriptional LysR family regulator